jgi:sortase A
MGLVAGCSAVADGTRAVLPAAGPARQVAPDPLSATRPLTPQPSPPAPTDVAHLSIPSIGVRDLEVVAYTGFPDDLPGTLIEDRGLAASPRGPGGGVGPGQVGNLVVTGHRTSAGGPLRRLPAVRAGAHVLVTWRGWVYDYVVTGTMWVSFRSSASRALQTAAVPGQPGEPATGAMITLSTCATPEDHARDDWWTDAQGNPEHRIDKVGVLVGARQIW